MQFLCKTPSLLLSLCLAGLLVFANQPARAQECVIQGIICDTEIEALLEDISAPVFRAAKLDPKDARIFILHAKGINAFATGRNYIFINSGLIEKSTDYRTLLAVVAHETAHLANGHVIRRSEEYRVTRNQATALSALAILAGIAGGRPDLAIAGAAATQQIAGRGLLSYTRSEESAADREGIRYLELSQVDPNSMLWLMQLLQAEQNILGDLDPYVLSHPIAKDRIRNLQEQVKNSYRNGAPDDPTLAYRYARARTKLMSFLSDKPAALVSKYKNKNDEISLLGLAIAYYKTNQLNEAVATMDKLQVARPNDPYYNELRGQFLYESGKFMPQAAHYYRKAVQFAPQEATLRTELGRVLLALHTPEANAEAVRLLTRIANEDREDPISRKLLAQALARTGDNARAALFTAEVRLLHGNVPETILFARRAKAAAAEGSTIWIRAQDILVTLDPNAEKN